MKILMLTTNSSLMDGINRHILNVAPKLNSFPDIMVAVCTVHSPGELNHRLKNAGVKTYSLNAANGHDATIFSRFYDVMKSFSPDIVHVHVIALFEKMVLAVAFRKVKYVTTVHGISDKVEHETFRMKIEGLLNRLFRLNYSARCFISMGVRDRYCEGEQDLKSLPVIYNPLPEIDKSVVSNNGLRQNLGLDESIVIVGTACRIAKVKNPEIFTSVMCEILRRRPTAHAVVIGDGDKQLIDNCKTIISEYNVATRFHWLGFREDAPELIKDLNCFVMTSESEGMPTSLLECMVSSTPFVFLRGNGGLKDIERINDTEGPFCIVGEKGDYKKFAENILNLIDDKGLSGLYVEKSKEIAVKYFSLSKVCHSLQKLYLEILGDRE